MLLKLIAVSCALAAARAAPNMLRIIGGSDAHEGQFPYQVVLQIEYNANFSDVICSGTILTERLIITSAYCVKYVLNNNFQKKLIVKAGIVNLRSNDVTKVQAVRAEKFYFHESYVYGKPGPYDIGVLALASPLQFNENVAQAVLPKAGEIPSGEAVVSGWGGTIHHGFDEPNTLQFVKVPIISYETCKALYDSIFGEAETPIKETNICTDPLEGKGTRKDDFGGPLVQTNKDGKYELIGVVSWEKSRWKENITPSVYTRVSAYIDYITEIMTSDAARMQ